MRYIVENPDITQLNEIMKKSVNNYKKNHYFFQIRCLLKVLTNTNDIQNFRIKPILNVQYISNPKIFIGNLHCFSQLLEMRITSASS